MNIPMWISRISGLHGKLAVHETLICLTRRLCRIMVKAVMQDLAWVRRFRAQNPKNSLFLANQEYPHPPELEFLMEGSVTSGLRLPKITPRIGTSPGGLSNFGSDTPPGLEFLLEDLVTLGLRMPRTPLPPMKTFGPRCSVLVCGD